jgi:hypothetical protein
MFDFDINPAITGVVNPVDAIKLRNNVGLEVILIGLHDRPRVASSADDDKATFLVCANLSQMDVD